MAVRNVYVAGANGIGYTKEVDSSADYASLANDTYFKDRSLGIGGLIKYKDPNGDILDIFTSDVQQSVDITHADLVIAKATGELVPGVMYRITDFQTIYDQPDFNYDGTPKTNPTVKTGPTEPIIVTAISASELGIDAFQEDHPNDTIQYILEFTTPITNTITKGRIIKRIDDKGNESDFDHRNVLFKRYPDRYDSYSRCRDSIGGLKWDEFTINQTVKPNMILSSPSYGVSFNQSVNGATPGRYIGLPQTGGASISGATGAEFSVTVSPSGHVADVDLSGQIHGYVIGDVIDVDVTQLGGSGTLTVTLQQQNFRNIRIDVDSTSGMTTSGNGQGAGLSLYYDSAGLGTVAVMETGSGYAIGDTITIPASVFAGISGQPASDLVLTLTDVITDFIEAPAIDLTKDYGNYLGDTYSNYLDAGIVGYQPAFDLPNIILGLDNYANNNRFHGYVRNVNIPNRCVNNVFSGGAIDFVSRNLWITDTTVSGQISNVDVAGQILNSDLGNVSNLYARSYLAIAHSTVNKLNGFDAADFRITESTVNEFDNNQIDVNLDDWEEYHIFNDAKVEIHRCQFNQVKYNTFHRRDSYMDSNNINILWSNTFGDGLHQFGMTGNTFNRIENCTFNFSNSFGNNRGSWLSGSTFNGHIRNNDFGSQVFDCVFGFGFGYESNDDDELESISHYSIDTTGGNVFRGPVVDCTFGRYSTGNVFNTAVTRVIFRDHLTNNLFDNLIHYNDISQSDYFILEGPSELYERQRARVFINRTPHEYTYSIGDQYMLGNFPSTTGVSNLYWYRSDISFGVTTNLFFSYDEYMAYVRYPWQNEPVFLGTQQGLNTSKLNTSLISEGASQAYWDLGDLKSIIKIFGEHRLGITTCIPSLDELQEIYNNYSAIGPSYGDQAYGSLPIFYEGKVWSSTESDATHAYAIDFRTGVTSIEPKTDAHYVILIGVKTYDYALKLEYVDDYGSTTIVDVY